MKTIFLLSFLVSSFAYSAIDMKPGLWKVKMVIKSGGEEINPTAQMQKVMANLPEAQKKAMREAMGKHSVGFNDDGSSQVCYTKEMIGNPEHMLKKDPKQQCDSKIITNTPTKIVSNFKCSDGTSGESIWNRKNSEAYTGIVHMTSAKGEKSDISTEGSYMKSDCGDVKPITQ